MVTNSRHNKRVNAVWRRRSCKSCRSVFTSRENADLEATMMVSSEEKAIEPFNRDKLFISIYESCGHRPKALEEATALTATAIARIMHKHGKDGTILKNAITVETLAVLHNFDKIAATHYTAYFAK